MVAKGPLSKRSTVHRCTDYSLRLIGFAPYFVFQAAHVSSHCFLALGLGISGGMNHERRESITLKLPS